MIDIYQDSYDYLINQLAVAAELEGGEQRAVMGKLVEVFVDYVWKNIQIKYGISNSSLNIGTTKPIKVISPSGYSINESVDRHIYINGRLVAAIECKTYLDKCYLQRADSDFNLLKTNNDFISIILTLQNACADESEKFFLDRNNINKIFTLSPIKRKSNRENHISRHTEWINFGFVKEFIEFIENIYLEK